MPFFPSASPLALIIRPRSPNFKIIPVARYSKATTKKSPKHACNEKNDDVAYAAVKEWDQKPRKIKPAPKKQIENEDEDDDFDDEKYDGSNDVDEESKENNPRHSMAYWNFGRQCSRLVTLPPVLVSQTNRLFEKYPKGKLRHDVSLMRESLKSMVFQAHSYVKGMAQIESEINRFKNSKVKEMEAKKNEMAERDMVYNDPDAEIGEDVDGCQVVFAGKALSQEIENRRIEERKKKKENRYKLIKELGHSGAKKYEIAVRDSNFTENDFAPIYLDYGESESFAYTAFQMPFAFAGVHQALEEIRRRETDNWMPKAVLDFGCGPGTGIWAAYHAFVTNGVAKKSESDGDKAVFIPKMVGVDICDDMLKIAESLVTDSKSMLGSGVSFQQYLPMKAGSFDLVICNSVLQEFHDNDSKLDTLEKLWDLTTDFLVLVERGNPAGYDNLMLARNHILGIDVMLPEMLYSPVLGQQEKLLVEDTEISDASDEKKQKKKDVKVKKILDQGYAYAPCSHNLICPMLTKSWCNFKANVQLAKFHMDLTLWKRNVQSTRYSYLVLRKGKRPEHNRPSLIETSNEKEYLKTASNHWDRILRQPLKKTGHVLVDVCSSNGVLARNIFARKLGKQIYRDARKSQIGDLWPHRGSYLRTYDEWSY